MLATRSGGNRVYTLDGEPALAVYLEVWFARTGAREPEDSRRLLVHPMG